MDGTLQWGRRYVMVEPNHFRVDYAINPFMDPADQPDPRRAMAQWVELVDDDRAPRRHRRGARRSGPTPGHGLRDEPRPRPRSARRPPTWSCFPHALRRAPDGDRPAQPWFAEHGRTTSYVGRDGVGAHLEAGDAFACGDALVVGYGPRTEELALKHLATDLDVRVRGLRITHPGMYHLDLAFCPLDERRAMVCPAAFDDASARRAAGAGARAAGADRGGGADDVLRQLDRDRPHRPDAGLPRPRPRAAGGLGLRDRPRRRVSSTRAAARSAA